MSRFAGSAAPQPDWEVRPVSGQAATKRYRCPGCDQEIPPGVPHVVAWAPDAVEDRRHWHRGCWHRATKAAARPPR
ncbi:MAG TPA: ATP/GTP-binding protein [Mycobacteriales bacterium]|nr:ATP/GTP-binding protein [Mycobacteriales bacterium]